MNFITDSYEKARLKLPEAAVNSDLATEAEDESVECQKKRKRK